MIKLENVVLPSPEQMQFIIEGMRNPMNSWDKSDSGLVCSQNNNAICNINCTADNYCKPLDKYLVGPNDYALMQKLSNAGTDHRKFMRMMPVYVRITAPLYWWKEYDTYKVGTVANSCSTMHKIHEKEFTFNDFSCEYLVDNKDFLVSDLAFNSVIEQLNYFREEYLKTNNKKYFYQMIQLLPSSYNQTRNVMLNYEVLANMYNSRKNHKLDEWRDFCKWVESLQYSELIINKNNL